MRGVLLAETSRNDSRSTIHMEAIGQRGGESRPITGLWRAGPCRAGGRGIQMAIGCTVTSGDHRVGTTRLAGGREPIAPSIVQ